MNILQKNNEKILLWTLVGFLALGQLGRISILPSVRFYPHDVLLLIWISVLLISNNQKFPRDSQLFFHALRSWWPFLITSGLSVILAFATTHLQVIPLLYLGRLALYATFACFITKYSKLSSKDFAIGGIGLGIITLTLGVLQLLFIPDTRFLYVLGFDDHYYRMIGTQLDPAFQGALLLIAFLVTAGHTKILKHTQLIALFFFSFAAGVFLTFSRASYLGLAIMNSILVFFSRKVSRNTLITVGASMLVLSTLIFFISTSTTGEGTNLLRTASISARLKTLSQDLPSSPQGWILGEGLYISHRNKVTTQDMIVVPNQAQVSDSLFIFILQSTGLLGLAAFLSGLSHTFRALARKKAHYSATLLLTLLVITQFNNTLLQPFVLVSSILAFRSFVTEYR